MALRLRLKPDYAEVHNNLAIVLQDQGRLEEAEASCRRALHLKPGYAETHNSLGRVLVGQGDLQEAEACFRATLRLKPDHVAAHSNLLYSLTFSPNHDARTVFEEHQRWNRQHAEPLANEIMPHTNDRSPDRRLKIGYVSPDFRAHSVGRWMLPLLDAHDHSRFEVYCYSSVINPDAVTARCRLSADVWREVAHATDLQLANLIRQDRIDILVDITMHMARNRLLTFARKPAAGPGDLPGLPWHHRTHHHRLPFDG